MRLLLIEDDETLGDGLQRGLRHFGYTVDWLKDSASATHALKSEKFDIIILDLGIPEKSDTPVPNTEFPGLSLLKKLRMHNVRVPVLILTAHDSTEDRVKGLDSGADDFLPKPFNLDELAARVRALLRRYAARAVSKILYGSICLDPASHTVTIHDQPVPLPRREFALLQKLLENQGHVLSRELLMQSLYGWEEEVDSNALEVHIHNLRKKLNADFIRTVRGVGYMVDKQE